MLPKIGRLQSDHDDIRHHMVCSNQGLRRVIYLNHIIVKHPVSLDKISCTDPSLRNSTLHDLGTC